jgi:redox-sensitive bicupin YhaK (pirin superfamily)
VSIRPIKRIIEAQPTLEGAGVRLRRAFGFGDTGDFDPFLLLDDFTAESRPSPTSSPERSPTVTAWATAARWEGGMCSG